MNKLAEDAKEILEELRSKVLQTKGDPDEAEGVALMLASRVLMGDGRLEREEADFLAALLPASRPGAPSTHAKNYAASWDGMIGQMPMFLRAAATYDREQDTHMADRGHHPPSPARFGRTSMLQSSA